MNDEPLIDTRNPQTMTLRDYFAIHGDQPGVAEIVSTAGLTYASHRVWKDSQTNLGSFDDWYNSLPQLERLALYARVRYAIADAMLAERSK
jgi:hypothetical protein